MLLWCSWRSKITQRVSLVEQELPPFQSTWVHPRFLVLMGFVLPNIMFSVECFVDHCLSFFFWLFYCLSFFDWWVLIITLVFSTFLICTTTFLKFCNKYIYMKTSLGTMRDHVTKVITVSNMSVFNDVLSRVYLHTCPWWLKRNTFEVDLFINKKNDNDKSAMTYRAKFNQHSTLIICSHFGYTQ